MAKMFNDKEKKIIHDRLMEKGKEFFATYGLKKTSVEDLTRAVGIAKGSFYTFFPSKEELYFDILEMEEQVLKEDILHILEHSAPITRSAFKKLLLKSLVWIDDNPFFKRLYTENEYELLFRKLPPESLDTHKDRDLDVTLPLLQNWQKEGRLIPIDLNVMASVLRSFFLLTLHKKEIGESHYEQTIDLIADCLAGGLIRE